MINAVETDNMDKSSENSDLEETKTLSENLSGKIETDQEILQEVKVAIQYVDCKGTKYLLKYLAERSDFGLSIEEFRSYLLLTKKIARKADSSKIPKEFQ